jgi:Dolichyl-phosphate-mannose-protein mannosyltransferase
MKNILIIASLILAFVISISIVPNGIVAISVAVFISTLFVFFVIKPIDTTNLNLLIEVFVGAILLRLTLASVIYGFGLEDLFGPDSFFYRDEGLRLSESIWNGSASISDLIGNIDFSRGGNWSMQYIVAAIYLVVGSNPLAVQAVSAVLGGGTAVLSYLIARLLYTNERVAIYTAIIMAIFPAMIIWSSQMLKDGFIVFLITLIILTSMRLQRRFNILDLIFLLASLLCIFTLRFYLFPVLSVAVIGGFVINTQLSLGSILSRTSVFVVIGVGLSLFGILERSQIDFERMSDLNNLENVRRYGSIAADSGVLAEDATDISTVQGAIQALPTGFLTLLLAPFPWQMAKTQQLLLLPEMILWWLMMPFIVTGLLYTVRNRLQESISVLLFTVILTISYSLFQGNLGTLYRQRTQIQIFLLMFMCVGFVIYLEKKENSRMRPIKYKTLVNN